MSIYTYKFESVLYLSWYFHLSKDQEHKIKRNHNKKKTKNKTTAIKTECFVTKTLWLSRICTKLDTYCSSATGSSRPEGYKNT